MNPETKMKQLPWKVYDISGKRQASCEDPYAAVCLLANLYVGGTIRFGRIVVLEYSDEVADSIDEGVERMFAAPRRSKEE